MPAKRYPDDAVHVAVPEVSTLRFHDTGSYKSVYFATMTSGSEEVLKVVCLPQDQKTDEARAFRQQELGRVQREISILAKCTSPFVVRLGTVAPGIRQIAGESCFVYSEEKLLGSSLKAVINTMAANPSEPEIKILLRCLVQGIRALWIETRSVHRDIKPANIFSTGLPDRLYVLLDLGIAYNVTEPGLTVRSDDIPHTPLYLAPEMVDANFRASLSYRADLYAAGVSVFEFATRGVHPLAKSGETLRRTYQRILTQLPTPLAKVRPDLSTPLCALVDQLLKKNPALRPGNFSLIIEQLA